MVFLAIVCVCGYCLLDPEGLSSAQIWTGLVVITLSVMSVMERQPRIRLWSSYAGVIATVFSFWIGG